MQRVYYCTVKDKNVVLKSCTPCSAFPDDKNLLKHVFSDKYQISSPWEYFSQPKRRSISLCVLTATNKKPTSVHVHYMCITLVLASSDVGERERNLKDIDVVVSKISRY